MELFRLHDVSYKPIDSVQKIDGLSWIERYQSPGEFQLIVENDISVLETLPLGSLISHNDTLEVMIVENREIARDEKKQLKVTLSGRSVETFAENRVTAGSEQPLYYLDVDTDVAYVETVGPASPSSLAVDQIMTRVIFGTEEEDAWLNTNTYATMRTVESAVTYVVKRGDVYKILMELLKMSNAGIKNVRPTTGTTLDLIVHDGADLTTSVIFYAQYEDLDDAQYFWSVKDWKNFAWVQGKYSGRVVMARGMTNFFEPLSRNRRYQYVEAQDLEGTYIPGPVPEIVKARGQSDLDKHTQVTLIQATVSVTAQPKFKINYDVGDLVTVFGEFDVAQTMRVTEHILAIDKDGMRGYPSLTIV